MNQIKITMIGTGYVGLVSGACFAEMGWHVTCMDIDAEKIRKLAEDGEIPIYEPGLKELVDKNRKTGRLTFTTNLATCVPDSDLVFIAVGTPQDEDGSADMQYVLAAARDIAPHLKPDAIVVNKSTVPVGTAQQVEAEIQNTNPAATFDVASNPEFLREGAAVKDFMEPDRIIAGTLKPQTSDMMKRLYAPLILQGANLVITNRETAEMIKYAANAFLAMKITFINEVAQLCEKAGANVQDVSYGLGLDSRIGGKFLQPGPGYGGSCFPKDTHAFAKIGKDFGVPQTLIEQTISANQEVKNHMADKIIAACGGDVSGKTIAVLGLAFKAGTDDMREASALTILPKLIEQGAVIQAFDPAAMPRAQELMPNLDYKADIEATVKNADAVVILTEWPEFCHLDWAEIQKNLKGSAVIDLRNLYQPHQIESLGLHYTGIGQ